MAFFPSADLLMPFLIAGIALNVTPGSDMAFVALSGARGGRAAGLAATAGIFAGCLAHILLAVIGLSALIAASQAAFEAVKWLGVAYLAYLAFNLIRQKGGAAKGTKQPAIYRPSYAFRQAMIVNVLNPKVGLFFIAFLPQFIEPETPSPWQQILALGLLFNTTGAIVNGLVGISTATAATRLQFSAKWQRATRWFAASVMVSLAIRLALIRNE
jgi:threonine/homoserine/homoserine lactone efflux protein